MTVSNRVHIVIAKDKWEASEKIRLFQKHELGHAMILAVGSESRLRVINRKEMNNVTN